MATQSKKVEVTLSDTDVEDIVIEELCKMIKIPVARNPWLKMVPRYRLDLDTNEIVVEEWDRNDEMRTVIRQATDRDIIIFGMIETYLKHVNRA